MFAFRWLNCFLLVSLSCPILYKILDTIFASDSINELLLYFAVALLISSKSVLFENDFSHNILFLQNIRKGMGRCRNSLRKVLLEYDIWTFINNDKVHECLFCKIVCFLHEYSTLMTKLSTYVQRTGAVKSLPHSQKTKVPGVLQYNGVKIQILDLPGIVEGARKGRGRGTQVVAVARTCSLIYTVLDITKPLDHI